MDTKDTPLSQRRCVPCEKGAAPLGGATVSTMLVKVSGWRVSSGTGPAAASAGREKEPQKIHKRYKFDDFLGAMAFVDRMAAVAEEQGHHPDFCVHYSEVDVTVWTHAVGGLSENDFILAAKIDAIVT